MLNLPFFKSAPKNKYLTIDFGSDTIKCLAFYRDGTANKIIGFGKQQVEKGHIRSGSIIDIEGVDLSLREAVAQATQNSADDIDQAIVGLNGSFLINQLVTARLMRGKSSDIPEGELEDIYERTVKSSTEQAYTELVKTTGSNEIDLELVTAEKAYVRVDDRPIHKDTRPAGNKVEMAVFTSFAPVFQMKNLSKLLKKSGLKIIGVVPEMYSLTKSLNQQRAGANDYLIINVGSDKTEIGVVFGGNLISTKSLPIGGYHFTYQMSHVLGLSLKEAENLKKSYSQGKLPNSESLTIQNCFTEILETWLSGIEIAFGEFSGVKTFSSKIYLTGGGINLPDAYDYLTSEPWTKSIPFKDTPVFEKINAKDMLGIHDETQMVNSAEWVMPASLSNIFTNLV